MGIRNLNRYLCKHCPESIKCININILSGKKIAVDISIYLYKYESENALLENMYVMLSIFKYYNIIPVFIFDGKPPPEKTALLKKRKADKKVAQEEYDNLKKLLVSDDKDIDKQDIISSMDKLKKQIVQINKDKINKVKSLIIAHGATYYDALGEADELCAMLVIKKKVWACLSEDMDMFVYGCTRVLRYLSLISHTVVLYNTKNIYNELKMSPQEFKQICVLSGTDYSINATSNNMIGLLQTIKHFNKFKNSNNENNFYDWLVENTNYVSGVDIELLNKINLMFNVELNNDNIELCNDIKVLSGPVIRDEIKKIMKEEDFIFCN